MSVTPELDVSCELKKDGSRTKVLLLQGLIKTNNQKLSEIHLPYVFAPDLYC